MKQVEIVKNDDDIKSPKKKLIEKETEILLTEKKPVLTRNKVPPKPKVFNNIQRNEQGIKLKKNGEPDIRSMTGKERIKKVREALERAKQAKMQQYNDVDTESDEDTYEFEVKIEEAKKEPEPAPPKPTAPVEPVHVEPVKPVKQTEPEIDLTKAELEKLRLENQKLKSQFSFNDHMNRISNLSRTMKLKF